jgi:ABC-type amino acid transport substrate-binding protein
MGPRLAISASCGPTSATRAFPRVSTRRLVALRAMARDARGVPAGRRRALRASVRRGTVLESASAQRNLARCDHLPQAHSVAFVRIFVSSPGDCEPERNLLDEVAERINRSEADRTGIFLRLFKWEDEVVPRIGPPPQRVVDDQTPLCDIYLGIMSSRFGGDGTRESGTEVEFRRALRDFGDKGQPWVLFYFNDDPPRPRSATQAQQLARVLEFREELEKLGIVGSYSGVRGSGKGFFERVEQDLRRLLQRPELFGVAARAAAPRRVDTPSRHDDEDDRGRGSPGPSRPTRQSRLDIVMSGKRLRCGATKHPPLSDYRITDDRRATFSGYYVELARDVAARNSLEADFVPIQWHEFTTDIFATPPADPRAVDLVISVFETSERRDYADFTCQFHCVDLCAVVQADSRIEELDALHDRRLRWAVAEGEAGWEYAARELRIDPYDTVALKHPDIGTALNVLDAGGADVAVLDRLSVHQFVAAHPDARLRVLKEPVLLFKNGIMIPRQDKLFESWVRDEFCTSRKGQPMVEAERQMLADCFGAVRKYA